LVFSGESCCDNRERVFILPMIPKRKNIKILGNLIYTRGLTNQIPSCFDALSISYISIKQLYIKYVRSTVDNSNLFSARIQNVAGFCKERICWYFPGELAQPVYCVRTCYLPVISSHVSGDSGINKIIMYMMKSSPSMLHFIDFFLISSCYYIYYDMFCFRNWNTEILQ
jgi:hypothetical protein